MPIYMIGDLSIIEQASPQSSTEDGSPFDNVTKNLADGDSIEKL
jgi:hypothetical protein